MPDIENDNRVQVAEDLELPSIETTGHEPAPAADTPADEPNPSHFHKSVAREYFESIVVTLIMALFGMTFITQAVKVPTGSMLNTILVEDHLLVNKFGLSPHMSFLERVLPYRQIRRGDIIVFKYPKNPEENYVKRVIGLPGDTILVRGTKVFVNGTELPENKVIVNSQEDNKADLEPISSLPPEAGATYTSYYSRSSEYEDNAPPPPVEEKHGISVHYGSRETYAVDAPYTVPADSYFCMGDNRDNSEDSRYWGPVPRANVVGRAMFVYWSIDESAREDNPGSNFFTDLMKYTRWDRTGTLIK